MDYDELVKRLRVWSLDERRGDGMLLVRTSDAIVQLQARVAELTDELQIECAARQTALAERDALRERVAELSRTLDDHLLSEAAETMRADKAQADLAAAQEEFHFQACLTKELMPYQERAIKAEADLAALVELGKERDYAMEMVNVQDNQIDALRALLKVAQDCIYSLDAREIYADELARIDGALAEDKP